MLKRSFYKAGVPLRSFGRFPTTTIGTICVGSRFRFNSQAKVPVSTEEERQDIEDTEIYLDKERGLNATKTDMHSLYVQPDTASYSQVLGDELGYGIFQNFFVDFACPLIKNHIKSEHPSLVDMGALYGNTTLAVVNSMDWDATTDFWFDPQKKQLQKVLYFCIFFFLFRF